MYHCQSKIFALLLFLLFISAATTFSLRKSTTSLFAHNVKYKYKYNHLVTVNLKSNRYSASTFRLAASMSSSTSTIPVATVSPPIPRREEDRVVYAGVAPDGWDTKVPRQSEESTEPLLDPPIPIQDPYGWLRDEKRTNQEVLDHLKAENEYTEQIIGHLKPLQEKLYKEFLNSIQETDYTTPRPRGDYWYYTRTFEGSSYKQYCRAPKASGVADLPTITWDGTKEAPILPGEEAYMDVNKLAEGKSYCSLGAAKISPSQTHLAYSVDFTGDEIYQVFIRDLKTGDEYPLKSVDGKDELIETSGTVLWGQDESTIFYMTMDPAHRPFRLYERTGWNDAANIKERLLQEELDDVYWSHAYKSLDGEYLFFESASSETSEVWFLKLAASTDQEMQCIAKRRTKVLYEVEHRNNEWWIWTNVDQSPNMKLMTCSAKADSAGEWTLVLDSNGEAAFDGSLEKALDSVTVLENYVVVQGRQGGIPRIWIFHPSDKTLERLEFEEAAHDVGLSAQYEYNAQSIAVGYDSLVTPPQTIEIPLDSASELEKRSILKSKLVPGYQKDLYGCDRLEIPSRDGKTMIPISVVYRKDVMDKAKAGVQVPLHLYGYGSYGSCCEADFDSTRLPLLDRGMIYVIAHIRGGGEMGRQWYEEPNGAKYLCKKNTFFDFCDVAKYLVNDAKWTSPQQLSCEGRSAGGMLVGSTINLEPELFKVAILGVPFVDVVGTMLDASIPLTCGEWVEWGNPNEKKFFQYMMEYSPMNNVKTGVQYPSCWLTGGLHDPRVQYWEPAKFVATLRHANPSSSNPVCLKMDMSAGHFSASDRYKYLKELAIDYSFLLDQLGLAE